MHRQLMTAAALLLAGTLPPSGRPAGARASRDADTRLVISKTLPRLNGEHLQVKVVEVSYGPGESSPAHSHPCAVIGYVVEGSYRTQVKGEAEVVYHAGQSFYEAPNGVHQLSANASEDQPVKFTAMFVCESDIPVSGPPRP